MVDILGDESLIMNSYAYLYRPVNVSVGRALEVFSFVEPNL